MFFSRRLMSFGLRMTLQHLQDNITSMRSLRQPLLQQSNGFSLAKNAFAQVDHKQSSNPNSEDSANKQKLGELQGKLKLEFTCKKCGTRNYNKFISKLGYQKGVVIVRCDGCKNNHLIADNLGWFGPDNKVRNIEVIMREKGEHVRRIRDDVEGYFEAVAHEEVTKIQRLMKEQETVESPQLVEEHEEVVKIKYQKVGQ